MKPNRAVFLAAWLLPIVAAAQPPRNEVPRVGPELDKLRTLTRDQQLHITNLKSQVERLGRDLEQLRAAQKAADETAVRLQADLTREHAEAEAMREKLAALGQTAPRPRANRKELVGTWKVVSVEENGAKRPEAVTRLVFSGSSITFQHEQPGRERVYTYALDPEAEPKELDVFGGEFRPTLAIYQLQDDRLTLCIDHRLTARPTGFEAKPESGTSLWTLQREPAAKGDRAPTPARGNAKNGPTLQAANTVPALPREN